MEHTCTPYDHESCAGCKELGMSDFASKTLHCQDGTSDKVYQVCIQSSKMSGRYDVIAKWGRRGNTLMSQDKGTAKTLGHALILMESLIEAKRKKGYKDIEMIDALGKAAKIQPKALGAAYGYYTPAPTPKLPNKEEDSFVSVGNTSRRIKE